MDSTLDIIIVNWNAGRQLRDCLGSIASCKKEKFQLERVVVVDNASSDGSLESIDSIQLPIHIIPNLRNNGFSAACNQGAYNSNAEYFLFLNPDTRLYSESLSIPIAFLQKAENQKIGIVGIQMVDDHGDVSRSCARFPTFGTTISMILGLNRLFPRCFPGHFMNEWNHLNNAEVDQVMGSFFLVRGSLFRRLGGFDERFFIYFEEVDFSLRARQVGFKSFYLADAAAYHKGGGTSEQVKALRLLYILQSRILYFYKHFNRFIAHSITMMTLVIEPFLRIVLAVIKFSIGTMIETIRGYILLWSVAPRLIVKGKKNSK